MNLLEETLILIKSSEANLKAEVDKVDVDKLKTVPVDLSKLSNTVNNDVVQKKLFIIN